jgi:hypothetical protein
MASVELRRTIDNQLLRERGFVEREEPSQPSKVLNRFSIVSSCSVRQSSGVISGNLRAERPLLERVEIAEDVVHAVREEFPWAGAPDATQDAPNRLPGELLLCWEHQLSIM